MPNCSVFSTDITVVLTKWEFSLRLIHQSKHWLWIITSKMFPCRSKNKTKEHTNVLSSTRWVKRHALPSYWFRAKCSHRSNRLRPPLECRRHSWSSQWEISSLMKVALQRSSARLLPTLPQWYRRVLLIFWSKNIILHFINKIVLKISFETNLNSSPFP